MTVISCTAGGLLLLWTLSTIAPPDPFPPQIDVELSLASKLKRFVARVIDATMPRVWYVRTLMRLKWNLRRQTGSSRLTGRVLQSFVDHYDRRDGGSQGPRLMPVSMDFCNYAIKQLVGIYGMWWMLYAFCPFFAIDERNMGFYSRRLRFMIIKYVLLPAVSSNDQAITRAVDAFTFPSTLVQHLATLERFGLVSFDIDQDWCTVPRVEMAVDLGPPLPVTFLPLNMALRCPAPPEFNAIYRERVVSSPFLNSFQDLEPFEATIPGGGSDQYFQSKVHELSPILIFVSHRWRNQGNPNASNEFEKLKNSLCSVVACALQACIALLHSGFPLERLVKYRPFFRPGFRINNGLPFDFQELQSLDFSQHTFDSLQEISGSLSRDIFALTAITVVPRWTKYEQIQHDDYIRDGVQKDMMLSVMKRIWLWYDYSCLPQHEIRKTNPNLQDRFKRTLQNLPQLQYCMHTMCMNGSDEYYNRAWCMSEFMNSQVLPLSGRSQFKALSRLGMSQQEVVGYKWFEFLIDPTKSFHSLLNQLGLRFTQTSHEQSDTPQICWIAWNSILRREHFQMRYYGYPKPVVDEESLTLFVGRGTLENVSSWLRCIKEALETPIKSDPGPLWIAFGNIKNHLPYNLQQWMEYRALAGNDEKRNREQIVVPFRYGEGDNANQSYFADALAAALAKIEEIQDPTIQVEVRLRNECDRNGHYEDHLGDFEAY